MHRQGLFVLLVLVNETPPATILCTEKNWKDDGCLRRKNHLSCASIFHLVMLPVTGLAHPGWPRRSFP